jgi:diaminopropionate ammonia-lyase
VRGLATNPSPPLFSLIPMGRLLLNPWREADYRVPTPSDLPRTIHRRLPEYRPSPLKPLPELAQRLGVRAIHLKDESDRLGLPAYKVLGAAWAIWRILEQRFGWGLDSWQSVEELRARLAVSQPLTLVTATDGNHGRGVARMARWLGLAAEIYLPAGSAAARVAGIAGEGARVVEVPGTYDAAVERAAAARGEDVLLVQDHGWPGYEEIPRWVAEGYETVFLEADRQLEDEGAPGPDLVLVQIGVGTLASAVVRHFRRQGLALRPALVGVEPSGAACALLSIASGHRVMIAAGAHSSIMAGLNCGTPSSAAWPDLRAGLDACVAVEDEQARRAMRELAAFGVVAGESGAAGLAGLFELMAAEHAGTRATLGIGPATRVLLLSTEGATDPVGYGAVVGG